MTNSEWLSWFFHPELFWIAPVTIAADFLTALGALSIGAAKRNIKFISIGIGLFVLDIYFIYKYHLNLKGFYQFDLISAKIFYSLVIIVITVLLIIVYRIRAGTIAAASNNRINKE